MFIKTHQKDYLLKKLKNFFIGSNIEFDIKSYYVPEGEGKTIEQTCNMEGKVIIDKSGNAVLKEILVNGREISFD